MDIKDMFQIDLINTELLSETKEKLFQMVGKDLQEKGFVNEGYINGITMREKEFPTGLITQHLNIALPHSDTEYVEKPFIYVARVKNDPLTFNQMGDNQELQVKDIFFLGIKDASKQVHLLSYLMDLFSNINFVNEYRNATEEKEIYEVINKYIQKNNF